MNMNQIMKQAQQMQKKLEDAQKEIELIEIEGSSGGGLVKVVITGKGHVKKVTLDPQVVDKDDIETLQDLFAAAVNNANSKKDEESAKKMSQLTGGMQLPAGLKLPF